MYKLLCNCYMARLPGFPMVQTSLYTKCLKPRHVASPALKILIALMDTQCFPSSANIVEWPHNANVSEKNLPPKALCIPEPQASSVRLQLCFWQRDCPPSWCPRHARHPGTASAEHSASEIAICAQKQNFCPISCHFSVSENHVPTHKDLGGH